MRGVRRALAVSVVLALLPSAALAGDPYAEYRIPDHRWLSWTGSAAASGQHEVSQSYGEWKFGSASASAASGLTGGFDSDARSHAYGLSLSLSGGEDWRTLNQDFAISDHSHVENKGASQSASGFLAYSRYPAAVPIGLSLAANGTFGLSQSWRSDDRRRVDPPTEWRFSSDRAEGDYNAGAGLTASLSFGRVRDATPVYQVQVLEQRLLEVGTITHPLSPVGRERLAALYTIEGDVAFAHQRPTKYFWRELERVLREDGVLGAEGLDAYSVQRLLEPLTIVGSGAAARARGFAFGPQVMLAKRWRHSSIEDSFSETQLDHDTLVIASESSNHRRFDFHDESILSGAFLDYHRPVGMRWQIDALSSGLITEYGAEIDWTNRASVNWLVADRWFATAGIQHELKAIGHGTERRPDTWNVNYGASVNYFLEDTWALRLGWSGTQSHTYYYDRRDSFSLGVTYQFAGWLSAPGVFEPMRLTPAGP